MNENWDMIESVLVIGAGWVGRQIAACLHQAGFATYIHDTSPETAYDAKAWIAKELTSLKAQPFDMATSTMGSVELDVTDIAASELAITLEDAESNAADLKIFKGNEDETLDPPTQATDETACYEEPKPLEEVDNIASQVADDVMPLKVIDEHQVHVIEQLSELDSVDLVIECVPEMIGIKKRTLRTISKQFGKPTIIASNSSYFVPSILSKFVAYPERFAHCHFHVPVLRPSVVDIVGCEHTDASVLDKLTGLVEKTGHKPIRLKREHPGYVFNWLLQAVLKAALELKVNDVAEIEDIDNAWATVTGMPLGPFGIMDQIGLDVVEHTLHNSKWSDDQSPQVDELLSILKPLIAEGRLGKKTLGGFYQYGE